VITGWTREVLEEAGWYVGRAVDTDRWAAEIVADGFPPLHPSARLFLAEFGGLAFPGHGSREPFTLSPTTCFGEAERFVKWGAVIGRNIAPIGDLAPGVSDHAFLGIDDRNEIYLVTDGLSSFGRMPSAMDGLIRGRMPIPKD
jgi:hypothetical protein